MPWTRRTTRVALAAVLTMLASGCGGDDGDDREPIGPTGAIVLTATPAALSVEQGTGSSLSVVLARSGGFSGAVTLSVSGLPTGITATITPTELAAGATQAAITVTVAAAVPAQVYHLTITASSAGVTSATATFALTVRTRSSAPTDIAYQYCDESTVPVFFAYQDGSDEWKPVLPVTSAGKTTFAFKLSQARGGVIAVYQSASSAVPAKTRRPIAHRHITRSLGRLGDRYAARLSRGQRRTQSALGDTYATEVQYALASELAQDASEFCALTQPTKSVTATVAGVTAGRWAILSLGSSTEVFDGGIPKNPMTFGDVRVGPLDFVATRLTPGMPPDRFIVLRNLDIPDGGSLPSTIDFNSASSVPATAAATIQNPAGDDLEIFTELVTARSGRSLFWFDLAPSANAARVWAGLPSATMVDGDFHSVVVFASGANEGDLRVSLKYVRQVANETLPLGPAMTLATTSVVASGAYPRFRFQGVLPAEYNKGIELSISAADEGNAYSIAASGSYLAAAGDAVRYDLTMPDVRSVDGFPAASRLTAGSNDVSFGAHTFTGSGVFDLAPNLGSEFRSAAKAGTITVP